MDNSCQLYEQQVKKAKETIAILETKLEELTLNLEKTNSSFVLQELRKTTLDMTITQNELEHSQFNLDKCLKQNNSI